MKILYRLLSITALILAPQKVRIILAACLTGLVIKAID